MVSSIDIFVSIIRLISVLVSAGAPGLLQSAAIPPSFPGIPYQPTGGPPQPASAPYAIRPSVPSYQSTNPVPSPSTQGFYDPTAHSSTVDAISSYTGQDGPPQVTSFQHKKLQSGWNDPPPLLPSLTARRPSIPSATVASAVPHYTTHSGPPSQNQIGTMMVPSVPSVPSALVETPMNPAAYSGNFAQPVPIYPASSSSNVRTNLFGSR